MQMEMLSTFSESNGIDPIATGEFLDDTTGLMHSPAPVCLFIALKIQRSRTMTNAVQKQPATQRCGIRVMAQNPQIGAVNLIALSHTNIGMQCTDRAIGNHERARLNASLSMNHSTLMG